MMMRSLSSNLWLVLATSLLFGAATGAYEFVLPLFLRAHGISFAALGTIFALAGLAMFFARIYMGGLADKWGRKSLYSWALGICGIATAITPLFPALVPQLFLRILRETATLTRETLLPIVLYEERQTGFLNLIGKFRGLEFLLQAGGTLLAGLMMNAMGGVIPTYTLILYLAGGFVMAGGIGWTLRFRETWIPPAQQSVGIKHLINFDIHSNLKVLAISGAIFAFGMMISHSFYLPLFFKEVFEASDPAVSIIMTAHRLTLALPLLVVGNLPIKNLRVWYIVTLVLEGLSMGGSAFIPFFWGSATIFLLHDLIGAGVWVPIQSMLIQRYSREESRGLEVGKVLAWGSVGAILGPFVAGYLAELSPRLPFLISGVFMALAAVPLFWLNLRAPEPTRTAQVNV